MSVLGNSLNLCFNDTLSEDKKNLRVVIFGSYREGGFQRLRNLKYALHKCGYVNTDLVEYLDYSYDSTCLSNSQFIARKSIYWIEESHVNLFVFFDDITHDSVTSELTILLREFKNKVGCTSFFRENFIDLGPVVNGLLRDSGGDWNDFSNDADLFKMAEKSCWHHLIEEECDMII